MKEIDRSLSRKPAPRGFAFLFWACIIGLFVFWPSDVTQAEPPAHDRKVVVSAAEIARLYQAHKELRADIDALRRDLGRADLAASNCLASRRAPISSDDIARIL